MTSLPFPVTSFPVLWRHLNSAKITRGTKLHLYANFQDDRSNGLGAKTEQTNWQTDRQTDASRLLYRCKTGNQIMPPNSNSKHFVKIHVESSESTLCLLLIYSMDEVRVKNDANSDALLPCQPSGKVCGEEETSDLTSDFRSLCSLTLTARTSVSSTPRHWPDNKVINN